MSFAIPSLKDLLERSRRSLRTHLPGTDAWVWPNNLNVIAKVFAGVVFELFAFAEYISRQMFAATADGDSLIRHGNEYGMPKLPAAPAYGKVLLTATVATEVLSGALFGRADGIEYRALSGAVTGGAGVLVIDVVASTNGKGTVAVAGTPLDVVSGVTGGPLAEVGSDGVVGGYDVEEDEDYRERILFRKRNPPHGGAASDYVMWSRSVEGVTRVFVERLWNGVGTVRVFILMDNLYPDGIPAGGNVARIADYLATVQPSGAMVTVAAPSARVVDITIQGLKPDTSAGRESVLAELREAFRRLSRVAGDDTVHGGMPYLASPAIFSRSWIWQAIANASGEQSHIVAAPASDIILDGGEIAVLGTVNFID